MDGLRKRFFDRPVVRILIAVAVAAVPFALHQELAHVFRLAFPPFLFFWPAIVLVALWLGFQEGVATTLAGAVLVWIWIFPSAGNWWPLLGANTASLVLYLVLGVAISAVAARYRKDIQRLGVLEAENELRASEDRFRAVLRESRDMVYRLDLRTGKYDYISPSTEAVLGYSDAEYRKMSAADLFALLHPDDAARVTAELREAERRGRAEIEYRVRGKDGKYRWLSNLFLIGYDAAGTAAHREGTIRDITAARAAQEAVMRSAALASAGRMSAAIAHEINNPLTAVTNLLFLAQCSEGLPEPVREYLTRADAELQRIGHITRRALGFYRETSAPVQVSIDLLLDSCIELFRRQMDLRGVRVEKDVEAGLEVQAFGGELRQVFTNLLSNSLDAVGKAGIIRIRARRGKSRQTGNACIRIAVADNGYGIAADAREQIFEPFFTTKGAVGTGLGLWVSAQLVEKNGGRIRVRSSDAGPWRGTVFVVELPA